MDNGTNSSSSRISACRNGSPRRRATSRDEGLDYEFRETVQSTDGKVHDKGDKVGAMQSFEEGRKSDVSCACHWTVNVAASKGHGKLYRRCLFGVAGGRLRAAGLARSKRRRTSPACRSRSATSRAAITRPSRRSSSTCRRTRSTCLSRRHAVRAHGPADRRQGAGGARCSAGRITSPSSSASAKSSTPPS